MAYLKPLAVLLGLVLFGFQLWNYLSIDEVQIRANVSGGVPTRFIQADEETLAELQSRLQTQEALPDYLLTLPRETGYGRQQLLLPDGEQFASGTVTSP